MLTQVRFKEIIMSGIDQLSYLIEQLSITPKLVSLQIDGNNTNTINNITTLKKDPNSKYLNDTLLSNTSFKMPLSTPLPKPNIDLEKYLDAFYPTQKGRGINDRLNKTRETLINYAINNPSHNIQTDKWINFRKALDSFLSKFSPDRYNKTTCQIKGGRKFNYDFEVRYLQDDLVIKTVRLEFKFNAKTVAGCPQYVSPMKPSQYLSNSFENYFYQNYLSKICSLAECQMPSQETYLSSVHSPNPKCLKTLQEKYYRGCKSSSKFSGDQSDINFYQTCRVLSREAINKFLEQSDMALNIEKLTEYLHQTQRDKEYMLFYQGEFYHDTPYFPDYTITSYKIQSPYFICQTESGKEMKILLRWKNGNGIAFPAFQIS